MVKTSNKKSGTTVETEKIDPEIEYLKEKSKKGAMNIVEDILSDPKVQKVIKKALTREVLVQAITMSCLMIGILKLYDVAKLTLGFGWQVELVISVVLILTGLIYMVKNMLLGKDDGD